MNPSPPLQPPPRGGLHRLHQRMFAWVLNRGQSSIDSSSAERKQQLLGDLHGAILEIGPGVGSNLRYYPAEVNWVGVEPNPFMHPYLRGSIQGLGWPAEVFTIHPGDPGGIRLPAGDASVDAVVSTHVLCSVSHPEGSLQEVLRVLKPGGRFVFIEHVAAPRGTGVRRAQDFIQPLWTFLADGCHPNRETGETINRAGFAQVKIEPFLVSGGGMFGHQIAGVAVK